MRIACLHVEDISTIFPWVRAGVEVVISTQLTVDPAISYRGEMASICRVDFAKDGDTLVILAGPAIRKDPLSWNKLRPSGDIRCMKALLCALEAASFATSCGPRDDTWGLAGDEQASHKPSTVLVELLTSEGCSNCPPADDVLGELVRQQPIANVNAIGLGEHVDYWDRLGWRNPFSAPAFTRRQSEYEARTFRTGSVDTPQMVVDGRFQEIGSDRAADHERHP
jgi:hypothetical protein